MCFHDLDLAALHGIYTESRERYTKIIIIALARLVRERRRGSVHVPYSLAFLAPSVCESRVWVGYPISIAHAGSRTVWRDVQRHRAHLLMRRAIVMREDGRLSKCKQRSIRSPD